jgi:CheY-like chemotaxis protein
VGPDPVLCSCPHCALGFAGDPDDAPEVESAMQLHARYCAGRPRSEETFVPACAGPFHRARRVVVADADPEIRTALRLLLEAVGHRVHEAADGGTALAIAVQGAAETVIIDMNLPGMDGDAVARTLRERLGTASPRLIAFTGWGGPRDRQRAREAGFDEFLLKPADPEAIERLVATSPQRSP